MMLARNPPTPILHPPHRIVFIWSDGLGRPSFAIWFAHLNTIARWQYNIKSE